MDSASLKRYNSSQLRTCAHCGKEFNVKGVAMHERSCGKKLETQRKDAEYERSLQNQLKEKGRQISELYLFRSCIFSTTINYCFNIFTGCSSNYNNEGDTDYGAYDCYT